ncbi:MAG: hypothetical protein ACTS47_00225 [Candidatus Hodgkinia cicadicola]
MLSTSNSQLRLVNKYYASPPCFAVNISNFGSFNKLRRRFNKLKLQRDYV